MQEKSNDYEDHFALYTSNLQNPKLCQDEVSELEHDLTKGELLNALKGFQPGKLQVTTVLRKNFIKLSLKFYGEISLTLLMKPFKQASYLYLRGEELYRLYQRTKIILWF